MRRLYSSFTRGAPGAGLLLLRLAAGGVLLADAVAWFGMGLTARPIALGAVSLVTGLGLLAGLWTPAIGALAAAITLWQVAGGGPDPGLHVLAILIDIALTLLGPGGWSIDARLFGWKRFEIENGHSSDRSLDASEDDPSRP